MDIRSKYLDFLLMIFFIAGFVMVMIGGLFTMEHIVVYNQGQETDDWHSINGTVIAYIVEEVDADDGDLWYRPISYYIYEVDNTTFDNDVITVEEDFSHWRSSDQETAVSRLEGYVNNTAVTVYYNPADHSQSVLKPGIPPSTDDAIRNNLSWLLLGMIFQTSIILIVVLRKIKRRKVINQIKTTTIPIQTVSAEGDSDDTFSPTLGHYYRKYGYLYGRPSKKFPTIFGLTTSYVILIAYITLLGTFLYSKYLSQYSNLFWFMPILVYFPTRYLFTLDYPGGMNFDIDSTGSDTDNKGLSIGMTVLMVFLNYMFSFLLFIIGALLPAFVIIIALLYVVLIGLSVFILLHGIFERTGAELSSLQNTIDSIICGFNGNCLIEPAALTADTILVIRMSALVTGLIMLLLLGLLIKFNVSNTTYNMHINTDQSLYSHIILADTAPLTDFVLDQSNRELLYSVDRELWSFNLVDFQQTHLGHADSRIRQIINSSGTLLTTGANDVSIWFYEQQYRSTQLINLPSPITTARLIRKNQLLIAMENGSIVEVEIKSGQIVTQYPHLPEAVQSIVVGTSIYMITTGCAIYELKQSDLILITDFNELDIDPTCSILAEDKLLLGTIGQGVWSYHLTTDVWQQIIEQENSTSSLHLVDDRVYAGFDDGKLSIFPISAEKTDITPLDIHVGPIISIGHSHDYVFTASLFGSIKLSSWSDLDAGRIVQ